MGELLRSTKNIAADCTKDLPIDRSLFSLLRAVQSLMNQLLAFVRIDYHYEASQSQVAALCLKNFVG